MYVYIMYIIYIICMYVCTTQCSILLSSMLVSMGNMDVCVCAAAVSGEIDLARLYVFFAQSTPIRPPTSTHVCLREMHVRQTCTQSHRFTFTLVNPDRSTQCTHRSLPGQFQWHATSVLRALGILPRFAVWQPLAIRTAFIEV